VNPQRRGTPDFLLLFLTFLLVCFGLAMVFSASYYKSDPWMFTKKQAIAAFLGTIGMLFGMNIHYTKLKKWVIPFFLAVTGMLCLVLVIGQNWNGAKSWIDLGPISLQPTEFAKLALVLYLANLISKKNEKFRDFKKGLVPALVIVSFVVGLVMLQPDLGSSMILVAGALIVIVVGGANLKHLFLLCAGGGGVGAIAFALYVLNKGANSEGIAYKIARFTSFLDPWSDPQGRSFQIIQSLYAFGHGGITGAGFGQGIQKLQYLPEAYNDFIFAIIGEELGFIGSALFILVYLLFIWRGIIVALRCKDSFGTLVGVGIMGMIAFQAVINIGGVTSSIPLTGVTLPLISYGGSSIMATLISMGILLGISREQSLTEKETKKT
jgi:cell division protein FtsW